ncbi:MAG: DUF3656 domain-containing protein [Akkermansia sp.]
MTCTGSAGEPLTVSCPEYGCSVQSAQPLQTAEKRPLTPEALKQQLGRLGGTGFRLASCECRLPNGLMLPLSILNQARRALVEQIQTVRQEREAPFPPVFPRLSPLPRFRRGGSSGRTSAPVCAVPQTGTDTFRSGCRGGCRLSGL